MDSSSDKSWSRVQLIILFSEIMLKFSEIIFLPKSKKYCEQNSEYLGIFHVLKNDFFKKLINYSTRHVLKWPRYYGNVTSLTRRIMETQIFHLAKI